MNPVVVAADDWRRQQWRTLSGIPVPVEELWGHHSGSGSKTFRVLLGNERYHVVQLGWRALGYSWAIVASRIDNGFARIFEGRGWGMQGAHTYRRNRISHGVLLVGGWQTATPAEVEACARSLAWLAREGARRGVTVEVVSGGHREAPGQSTSCPEAAGLRVVRRAQQILVNGELDPQPGTEPDDLMEDEMIIKFSEDGKVKVMFDGSGRVRHLSPSANDAVRKLERDTDRVINVGEAPGLSQAGFED